MRKGNEGTQNAFQAAFAQDNTIPSTLRLSESVCYHFPAVQILLFHDLGHSKPRNDVESRVSSATAIAIEDKRLSDLSKPWLIFNLPIRNSSPKDNTQPHKLFKRI